MYIMYIIYVLADIHDIWYYDYKSMIVMYLYLPVFIVQVSMDIINTVTAKSPVIYVSLVAPLHKMYEHIIYIPFLTKTRSVSYIK